jgi:hypothetical protein
MACVPYTWDRKCMEGQEALMTAEFHHWASEEGYELTEHAAATVLLPGPGQPGLELAPLKVGTLSP